MKYCFALLACLLVAASSFADIPGPGPRPPRPPLPPFPFVDVPAAKPNEWPLRYATIELVADEKDGMVLEIPRRLFNQIKQAANEGVLDNREAVVGSWGRTSMVGLALSLAIAAGGLWLTGRFQLKAPRPAIALSVGVIAMGALSLMAWANPPPPPGFFKKVEKKNDPGAKDARPLFSIKVVDDGQSLKMYVPASMLPPAKANPNWKPE